LIRATRGLVFLREMTVQQLLAESRALRQQTETRLCDQRQRNDGVLNGKTWKNLGKPWENLGKT
jgi:hypothetical protein